jgi:hypothetical protein
LSFDSRPFLASFRVHAADFLPAKIFLQLLKKFPTSIRSMAAITTTITADDRNAAASFSSPENTICGFSAQATFFFFFFFFCAH